MKEFFVGLLVLLVVLMFGLIGTLLVPFFLVLGYFLRYLVAVALIIFAIWVLGKVALWGMERLKNKKT
ncbi:MAG: hypothetical protein A2Z88_10845 [Omnitrophica WOR_2 bacterium GWA2_47_8]|nr:MAG: hypothetical protein A2Z88_10845 [Omnitrophica WOR_2 bacterium GWA2_47_8]